MARYRFFRKGEPTDEFKLFKLYQALLITIIEIVIASFVLTAIHEGGHMFFAALFGVPILGFFISFGLGGYTLLDQTMFYALPDVGIFFIYIGGLLFELLAAYAFTQIAYTIKDDTKIKKVIKSFLLTCCGMAGWSAVINSISLWGVQYITTPNIVIGMNDMTALVILMGTRGNFGLFITAIVVQVVFITIGALFMFKMVRDIRTVFK